MFAPSRLLCTWLDFHYRNTTAYRCFLGLSIRQGSYPFPITIEKTSTKLSFKWVPATVSLQTLILSNLLVGSTVHSTIRPTYFLCCRSETQNCPFHFWLEKQGPRIESSPRLFPFFLSVVRRMSALALKVPTYGLSRFCFSFCKNRKTSKPWSDQTDLNLISNGSRG